MIIKIDSVKFCDKEKRLCSEIEYSVSVGKSTMNGIFYPENTFNIDEAEYVVKTFLLNLSNESKRQ